MARDVGWTWRAVAIAIAVAIAFDERERRASTDEKYVSVATDPLQSAVAASGSSGTIAR